MLNECHPSLLMRRVDQNFLSKRDGLNKPMGRATALQEAKDWLRKRSAKEVQNDTAQQPGPPAGLRTSTDRNAAPVCCSGWFGGPTRPCSVFYFTLAFQVLAQSHGSTPSGGTAPT